MHDLVHVLKLAAVSSLMWIEQELPREIKTE